MMPKHRHAFGVLRSPFEDAAYNAAARVHRLNQKYADGLRSVLPRTQNDLTLVCLVEYDLRCIAAGRADRPELISAQVLDDACRRCINGNATQWEKRPPFERRYRWQLFGRIQRRPHQPVSLLCWEGAIPDSPRRCIGRMRGNVDAAGGSIGVSPAVILALQLPAIVDTDREPSPAMQATVLPDVHVSVVSAPNGELAAQQLTVKDVPKRKITRSSDRVPANSGLSHRHPRKLQTGAGMTP